MATSVVWQDLAPLRRLWNGGEAAVSRLITGQDSATRGIRRAQEKRTALTVRESGLFRILDRTVTMVTTAWDQSLAVARLRQASRRFGARPAAVRVRLGGAVTAVAASTALVLQRIAPRPIPFAWIVPSGFIIAGVCLILIGLERPAR